MQFNVRTELRICSYASNQLVAFSYKCLHGITLMRTYQLTYKHIYINADQRHYEYTHTHFTIHPRLRIIIYLYLRKCGFTFKHITTFTYLLISASAVIRTNIYMEAR
jgi:hypothetical protein